MCAPRRAAPRRAVPRCAGCCGWGRLRAPGLTAGAHLLLQILLGIQDLLDSPNLKSPANVGPLAARALHAEPLLWPAACCPTRRFGPH